MTALRQMSITTVESEDIEIVELMSARPTGTPEGREPHSEESEGIIFIRTQLSF